MRRLGPLPLLLALPRYRPGPERGRDRRAAGHGRQLRAAAVRDGPARRPAPALRGGEGRQRARGCATGVRLAAPFLDVSSHILADPGQGGLLSIAWLPTSQAPAWSTRRTRSSAAASACASSTCRRGPTRSTGPADSSSRCGTAHPAGTTAASCSSGRTACSTSARGTARSRNRYTAGSGQSLTTLLAKILRIDPRRQDGGQPYGIPAGQPGRGPGRPPRDLRVRRAQRVALLVRHAHERAGRRRRRRHAARGDRLRRGRRPGGELRLEAATRAR